MRISLEWLSDYVDLVLGPAELAERLTASGTVVEGIEAYGEGFAGLVVGRVLEVKRHPAADRLSLCRVDAGDAVLDIVCGAPNVAAGMAAPLALPGSSLPDGTAIRESTIRGVVSHGMLLSGKELGISEDAAGIMPLDDSLPAGTGLAAALGVPDTVFELEVTPNRPDCLSVVGVAREVAALTGQRLRLPSCALREGGGNTADEVEVEIVDADLCSRYAARIIAGLRIGDSPWWMRRRLQAAGVRPISNVVDVTNYVMLELGQPLHAFDHGLIREGRIIVRRAEPAEVLVTLDGVERQLSRDDLLICDPSGGVALAGIMGGEDTEISGATTKVLLESAHFDPANIMRTSRLHELSSEASYRFERGVDPNGCVIAADRASYLMQELAGGTVYAGVVDARGRIIEPLRLALRARRAARHIGIDLDAAGAGALLESIGIDVLGRRREGDEEIVEVEVPTFRPDLEREIDLVEEVARLYGYERIPSTLPCTSSGVGGLTRDQMMRRRIAAVLAGLGLYEAVALSFISRAWMDLLDPRRAFLPERGFHLRNPVSEEVSLLRPTLLPGLLEAVRFNINRRVTDVHLFEMGRVFLYDDGRKLPLEPLRLGCVLAGRWLPGQWSREAEEVDFFTAKGICECLASALHIADWRLVRREFPFLHPSQSCAVVVGGREAGWLGMIHPALARDSDLPDGCALMEIDVASLLEAAPETAVYQDVPRYPSLQVDIAVVVGDETDSLQVEEVIREAGGELLRGVRPFDVYRGEQVGAGEKSVAYNLTFFADERTLRDDEVRSSCEAIVDALRARLGAGIRGL